MTTAAAQMPPLLDRLKALLLPLFCYSEKNAICAVSTLIPPLFKPSRIAATTACGV